MSRILLVQPDAAGRISGGFRYNAEMSANGAWDLLDVSAGDLGRELDRVDGDLVVADGIWLTERTFAPFLRLMDRGVRVAVLLHSYPSMIAAAESGAPPPVSPSPFELETLGRVGRVILPGLHYAASLEGSRAEVHVFEPGVADGWRTLPRPRRGPCSIVSVGAVTPRKGFVDVAEVLRRRVTRGDWRWTVAGSLDVDAAYAQSLVRSIGDLPGVTLMGQQAPDEVRRVVTAADVLVMPSYDENQPLVLLEAQAASVPTIAYAAGATARIVQHGLTGWVGPVGDRSRLAVHLDRLLGDEPERYRMAEACWERQKRLPSWASAAKHARAELERALGAAVRPEG